MLTPDLLSGGSLGEGVRVGLQFAHQGMTWNKTENRKTPKATRKPCLRGLGADQFEHRHTPAPEVGR